MHLGDNADAWLMDGEGNYRRSAPRGRRRGYHSQRELMRRCLQGHLDERATGVVASPMPLQGRKLQVHPDWNVEPRRRSRRR